MKDRSLVLKYTPLDTIADFECVYSDLHRLEWKGNGIVADFYAPGDPPVYLRVRFKEVHVIRVLDETPLSTETDLRDVEGLVANHFAYMVTGSTFWSVQSVLITDDPVLKHYRFVTGWTCLDVISRVSPHYEKVLRTDEPPAPYSADG